MNKKILVTGAAGFIGFHVSLKFLKKGFNVHGYDSVDNYYDVNLKYSRLKILKKFKKFSFTKNNLKNKKKLEKVFIKFSPDIVIHLAAQAGVRYSIESPDTYFDSNIHGTYNILNFAKKFNIRHLIIGSSSSVYGANRKSPFSELDKTDHQVSFYAASKKCTEIMARSYCQVWKIPTTVLRFFTVYGPWGRPDMAYYIFTKNIINNKKIDIYNNGKMYRDFTYIDDVTNAIFKLYNKMPTIKKNKSNYFSAPYNIFNIGNNKKIYLIDFINTLEKILNKKANKNFIPMQVGDVHFTYSNSNKLKNFISFKSKTSYEIGLEKFVKWYKKYFGQPK